MRLAFDRRGRDLGLTRSQWWVLTALYAMEGVPQSELTDYMDVEKATLGRLIDRLEEKGWVERRPDTIDRRVKRLFLTARVQSLMRALRAVAALDFGAIDVPVLASLLPGRWLSHEVTALNTSGAK